MPDDPRRSIVIPMFNEANRIAASLARIASDAALTPGLELVLVDDGSTDATVAVARQALETSGLSGVVVKRDHEGKGAAVAAGTALARGGVVGFVDADLSTDVDAISAVFDAVEHAGVDIAIASRRLPDSTIARPQPRHRELAGRSFNLVLRALGLTTRSDTQCGCKAFTAEAVEITVSGVTATGFCFDVEVLLRADRADLTVVEVPVAWRHADESSVRLLGDAPSVVRELYRLRRRYR
ncbi:MAG: glycosyltransferase [Acidimicrobiia bacterium]|nr:glycosyltransferase [Acidimicrobiia bacterium]